MARVILTAVGADRPGLVGELTGYLHGAGANILDTRMVNLRGRIYDFKNTKFAVTYHPAYLLRDPRQKKEAWKDLQMVMKYLGMMPPPKAPVKNA